MKQMMKWTFAVIVLVGFAACDIIDNPIKDGAVITPPDTAQVVRKIIIEDFTGHRCQSCPNAAQTIKDLETLYGNRVIGVAIHARPNNFTGTTPDYPIDFTTPEGKDIYDWAGNGALFPLPMGMVSRIGHPSVIGGEGSWPDKTAGLIDSVAHVELSQQISYNSTSREITVDVEAKALKNFSDDLKYCIMILESGIIAPQKMPNGEKNPDYVHNHVLRDMMTFSLGDELALSPIVLNDVFTKQNVSEPLDAGWNEANIEVVSFVFNARTYEILQAEKTLLTP